MVSIMVLAALGGLAAAAATAVTTGDASAAVKAAPHGLQVALAHVPSWTHAHQVLTAPLCVHTEWGAAGRRGPGVLKL